MAIERKLSEQKYLCLGGAFNQGIHIQLCEINIFFKFFAFFDFCVDICSKDKFT